MCPQPFPWAFFDDNRGLLERIADFDLPCLLERVADFDLDLGSQGDFEVASYCVCCQVLLSTRETLCFPSGGFVVP